MTFVWQALADWKTYVQALNAMWYAAPVTVHSLFDTLVHSIWINTISVSLFTPTIVHNLGFSAANAQLLSVPPFLLAGLSTYILSTWSDRVNLRGPFIAAGASVSMIGYIIAYTTTIPGLGYTAAIIAACGVFPCLAIMLAWTGGNAGGNMKRGIVLAVVIGLGNLGGCASLLRCIGVQWELIDALIYHCSVCSSFVYYQPPHFHKGHGTMMGCLGMRYVLVHQYEEKTKSFCSTHGQCRLQLHHDVDIQEAEQGEGGTVRSRRN